MSFFHYFRPEHLIESNLRKALESGDTAAAKDVLFDIYLSAGSHQSPRYMETAAELIARGEIPTKDSFETHNLKSGADIDHEASEWLARAIHEYRSFDLYEGALPWSIADQKKDLVSELSKVDTTQPILSSANRDAIEYAFHGINDAIDEVRYEYALRDLRGEAKKQVYGDRMLNDTYDRIAEDEELQEELRLEEEEERLAASSHLPDFNDSPVKDPKPKTPAPPNPEFDAGREVSGSLPPGVSLGQSGYKKHYRG